jgi:hypothetical protein
VGATPIDRWRSILKWARKRGEFVGVDEERYPKDFATLVRYHADLERESRRYPVPRPLALEELDAIVGEVGGGTRCVGPDRICEGNSRESSNLSPPTGGCLLDAYLLT